MNRIHTAFSRTMMRVLRLCGAFILCSAAARGAVVQDATVDLEASVSDAAPHITLKWSLRLSGTITAQTLYRRVHGETKWPQTNVLSTAATQFADATAVPGVRYEYWLHRTYNADPYSAYGHLFAGMNVPPVEARGTVVLLVDATLAAALTPDIQQLTGDLAGDGWQVIRHDVARSMAVTNVRELVRQDYLADSNAVKAVYVLGHVPVPYSGAIAPDGHGNHSGAWPADVYYAEMNGVWSDAVVSNVTASDARNRNVPGDGKFDQSSLPGDIELQIGRVDLYNMTQYPNSSVSETDLMRRYLRRAHDYRTRRGMFAAEIPRRALIDDNFGFYGSSEGFANTAFRTAYAWGGRGAGAYYNGDWFATLGTGEYLFAYGCGAGSYTSATGVGNSGDFGAKPSKAVFTCLFGSYHGDWDYKDNLMRASLAAREDSYTLSCAWAGRPQWFFHHMALGEPIGHSARVSQNNSYIGLLPAGSSYRQVHVALMGDPTLRLYPAQPPVNPRARGVAGAIELAWDAPDDTNILGYYVYRAASITDAFVRVTNELLTVNACIDGAAGAGGAWTYMVRGVKLEHSAAGTFTNLSQGVFAAGVEGSGAPFSPGALEIFAPSSSPIHLAWQDNSDDETGFIIERATAPDGAFTAIGGAGAGTNRYDDAGPLTHGAVWRYRVAAAGVNATSPPSNVATVQGSAGFIETPRLIVTADVSNETVAVPVQRYGGSHGAAGASYMTINSTARPGADYVAVTGALEWADGVAGEVDAGVQTVAQPAPRLARSFRVLIDAPTGGVSLTALRSSICLLTDARAAVTGPWNVAIIDAMTHTGAASMAEGVIGSAIYGGGIPNGTFDSCRFISQPVNGDSAITSFVRMDPYSQNARLGLMIRNDLNRNAPCVSVCMGNNRVIMQSRPTTGAATASNGEVWLPTYGVWLRLQRLGNTFNAFYSTNGTAWVKFASATVALNAGALWGMAHSGDPGGGDFQLASFSNAMITAYASAAPVCSNDAAAMMEDGGAIPVYVLTNDYAPDGGPLTVINAGPALNGTVQVAGGGTHVTYRPAADFCGTDTFVYVAREPFGRTNGAVATVVVSPVNDGPAVRSSRLITTVDTPLPFTIAARDPEGDPLSYTLCEGPGHGAVTGVMPRGVYLPAAGFAGLETMRVAVADPAGAAATAMVWITVAPAGMVETRLLAWGYNYYGQLGLGHTTSQPAPTAVPVAGSMAAIAAGDYHSLAVGADGVPLACGFNSFGGLGLGTTASTEEFVRITGLSGISSVAAGRYHSLFAGTNGQVWACGYGAQGQLGDGAGVNRLSPVPVPGLSNIVALACGIYSSYALDTGGFVHSFGDNASGQLGDGTKETRTTPVLVAPLSNVTAIAAGGTHAMALDASGQLWTWGYNANGQLGLGNTADQLAPTAVPGMTDVVAIAAGYFTSHALHANGALSACGQGWYGQLGLGELTATNAFAAVPGIAGAEGVAAGYTFAFARGPGEGIAAAGNNIYGQLGLPGAPASTNVFLPLEGFERVMAVAGGGNHALALQRSLTNQPPVADSKTVSASSGVPLPITLTAGDAEGDALVFMVVDQPAHGVLDGAAPSLVYTSSDLFAGTDTFTFVAADWQPGPVAVVRILVIPEPAAALLIAAAMAWCGCAAIRRR
ncbi:hypothetical protein GX586_09550 [bacterium]|nr:hypothetical protein [bacterium]